MARPSKFTKVCAEKICARLMQGESPCRICMDDRMPDRATVCRWMQQHESFRGQYAQARSAQADTLADE